MEAYNKYKSIDIYSTDKYSLHYYKLKFFSEVKKKLPITVENGL